MDQNRPDISVRLKHFFSFIPPAIFSMLLLEPLLIGFDFQEVSVSLPRMRIEYHYSKQYQCYDQGEEIEKAVNAVFLPFIL